MIGYGEPPFSLSLDLGSWGSLPSSVLVTSSGLWCEFFVPCSYTLPGYTLRESDLPEVACSAVPFLVVLLSGTSTRLT